MNNKEIITEVLKSGDFVLEADGWGYYEPAYFLQAGFPVDFVEGITHTTKSDGTWKGSMWKDQEKGILALGQMRNAASEVKEKNGDVLPENWLDLIPKKVREDFLEVYIDEQTAVYYLTFLRELARIFGVQDAGSQYIGRGFAARAYVEAINEAVGLKIPA